MRAKYYPDGKLLNAKQKSGSSFTWQSILAGLECFKKGYIWRVGDGTQINIWSDHWIPGSNNLKVQTPRGSTLLSTVSELINPIDGTWDRNLIEDIFWQIDVQRILQIPITQGRDDLVAWHYNRNGIFSVRSAYHCQWTHQFGKANNRRGASDVGQNQVWRCL